MTVITRFTPEPHVLAASPLPCCSADAPSGPSRKGRPWSGAVLLMAVSVSTALASTTQDPIVLQVVEDGLRAGQSCEPAQPLCLDVTVSLADPQNPAHCGTGTSLVADVGDTLAWCYTVTNQSTDTLQWHNLSDGAHGSVFAQVQQALEPGQSLRYVHRRIAGSIMAGPVAATWTSSVEPSSYVIDDAASFDYIDVSEGIELQWTGGFARTRSASVQLPFSFDFLGVPVDQLCVGKNGGIEVGLLGCTLPSIFGVPTIYAEKAIAVAWSEFEDTAGSARLRVIGDTPGERKAVIEWRDMVLATTPPQPGFTFQLVIDEATDELLFQYLQMGLGQAASGDNGARAVAGVQRTWYLAAQQYSGTGMGNLYPGKAVRWTPLLPGARAVSAAVEIDIGAPRLLLPLPQIHAETPAGTTTYRSLPLVNIGNRRLDWRAGEYPVQSLVQRHGYPALQTSAAAPAAVSSPRARSSQPVSGPAQTWPAPSARAGDLLPTFAVEHGQGGAVWNLIRLDLLDPAHTTTPLLPDLPSRMLDFSDSSFVGNDLSQLWVMDWRSRAIHTVDTDSGDMRMVGVAQPRVGFHREDWYGLAWDPATDTLYGSTATAACGWSGLYRIDMASAHAEFVGPIVTGDNVCVTALAFDPNGQLYAVDISSRALVAIDKHTGIGQLIGSLGYIPDGPQGLAIDQASGELYLTATPRNEPARIGRLDPVTGAPQWMAPPANGYSLSAISIARAGGGCSEALDAPWLELSTQQGAIEPNTTAFTIHLDFDATALDPGDYAADVCIFNNDPEFRTRPEVVPIRFQVQAPPSAQLFADGFE